MKVLRMSVLFVPVLASCSAPGGGTLAELHDIEIEIKEETIEGGLEKAMASYQHFLAETPESAMTPEAIRRLADLKVEREYGYVQSAASSEPEPPPVAASVPRSSPPAPGTAEQGAGASDVIPDASESVEDFESRATASQPIPESEVPAAALPEEADDLERAGAREAIALYEELLEKYPLYERNDQVLYQMSRAYEELGRIEEAMQVMNRIVREYPHSRYIDEVQFRRAEYYFTRKRFLDAEDAYKVIVDMGRGSRYYELALYKLGWAFYKQDLYEEALHEFVAVLDYKVSTGYDFEQTEDKIEKKRLDDTYRVISLSFSNLGGPEVVTDYFRRFGNRSYEKGIYSNLGEFYVTKRRFSDAASAYEEFIDLHPFDEVSPHFHMRVIEIYDEGGFPKLVVESKKEYARLYGLNAEYWHHFDTAAFPEVLEHLKTNLKDLANHYHALYQDKRFVKEKAANYREALRWYREFLAAFPNDGESPAINYQLADLLLENEDFSEAAVEYERTAYEYPRHEKASEAGYAAVYVRRRHLDSVSQGERGLAKREVVRSSLRFVDTFPRHEKAAVVLGAATDDLYEMKDFELAIASGRKLIANYPSAEQAVRRSAWLVVAHASFDTAEYQDAESAYAEVIALTPERDAARKDLTDNLAAAIYKQGEQAQTLEEYRAAVAHYLRIARVAPGSEIRPTAEYDAAVVLMKLEDWSKAADVLVGFRRSYPEHPLQSDVTKKIAFVYKAADKLALAAAEYERIEKESSNDEERREALLVAAELYEQAEEPARALGVYRRYVEHFPRPVEDAIEARFTIAGIYELQGQNANYLRELKQIVDIESGAGAERTDRTRYIAASSALVLAEPLYDAFAEIELVQPFEQNLKKKQRAMKGALDAFAKLTDYGVGDATAAATYYMAETYYGFGRALLESERPDNLNELEREEYELALEEQAYPFEDKAIEVHRKNLELMPAGIYNDWIDKSLGRLAKLIPVRYAKSESTTGWVQSIDVFRYRSPTQVTEDVEGAGKADTHASLD